MKVLVAEDNPDSRQLIEDILESSGYQVISAQNGLVALELAQQHMPDLAILDVNMPGMSGFDVCAALKSDEHTSKIPVLMLTALADVENRVYGLGMGADDYLTKPYNPRELVARVNTRLRAKVETDNLRETQAMIRRTFERFVSASVVEQLLKDPSQVKLGGKLQEITVLFADLEGFTTMSEHTEPEKLLQVLNSYHELIVSVVQAQAGTVDKFIGDAVMALWNTPLAQSDHPVRAVRAAFKIRAALADFHPRLEAPYRLGINFGIHTGMAVVGNVGSTQLMDFTAVGDTVNLAARLQSTSRDSQILISQTTYNRIRDDVVARPLGSLSFKGRSEAVETFEILELSR